MITLIALLKETQHGEENIYDTVVRAERFRELAKSFNVEIKGLYWTMGGYDGVLILECPDAKTGSALLCRLGKYGEVRTETMQAYEAKDMQWILERSEQV